MTNGKVTEAATALLEATERHVFGDECRAERDAMRAALTLQSASPRPTGDVEAMTDALSGWRYIRQHHGDLYGVGWDRVETALAAALATLQPADPVEQGES